MAKVFTVIEGKNVLNEHKRIIEKLGSSEMRLSNYREKVIDSSANLINKEVMKVLHEIPIEDLNRDKKGIRVKLLREYGFTSMADIASASINTISAIHGISQDRAHFIKIIVNDLLIKVHTETKIRLSVDDKNLETTQLVLALSQYRQSQAATKNCQNFLELNENKVKSAIQDLNAALGTIKWLFASKSKKQKAADAYVYLKNLEQSKYMDEAEMLISKINEIDWYSSADAWKDFETNPISFFNTLEEINPGVLGNDDAVYGLPEELAHEIQTEQFSLNGLKCELRKYQEWGVKYILHQRRVLLGDEMGLGKTVQAIAAMVALKNAGRTHFIVVCPASVITNWCREIEKMSSLKVIKVHGSDRMAALYSWLKDGGVAITTYETTVHFRIPEDFRFGMLVVDEAHYIKNPSPQRTINTKRLCEYTDRVLFMTGTALENKVEEMVSLIEILQPQIASKLRRMTLIFSAPQFRKSIISVYYRRKREDVLTELPELIENKEWCSLNQIELNEYEKAVLSRNYVASRRVSWNVEDIRNSSKATRLIELVNEAESEGRKVIVFSFFLDTIHKISMLLGERCTPPINGSVSPKRRQEIIDEFDKAPAGTVLVAQILSGGTGLNIQSASVVIICEPQFKPSTENQAISRAYRMGQTRNVLVYRLLCENTVDEKITALLETKQVIFDAYADKSIAAMEELELNDSTFGNIIDEEIERIQAKYNH